MTDLTPGSPDWLKLVTASKVGAILGLSTWDSPYSMWRKMRGDVIEPDRDATPAQERGNYQEAATLAWFYDKNPDLYEVDRQFVATLPGEEWALATLDSVAYDVETGTDSYIVEAKSAAYADKWGTEGTDEIPADYLAQVHFQLALMPHAIRAYVPVIFGMPFEYRLYVVERDDALCGDLLDQCRTFWLSLADDIAPDLDDTVATWDSVRKLHPDIEDDAALNLTRDEAVAFIEATGAKKDAEAAERLIKSQLLDEMGRAKYAECDGVRVARRQAGKYGISLVQVAKTIEALNPKEAA